MKTKKIRVSDSDEISVQVFKPQLYINNLVILFRWYLMSVVWLVNYCRGSTFSSTSRSLRSSSGMICILCYCLRVEVGVSPPHPPLVLFITGHEHIRKTHPKANTSEKPVLFSKRGSNECSLNKTGYKTNYEVWANRYQNGGWWPCRCESDGVHKTRLKPYAYIFQILDVVFKYHFQVAIYWFKSSPLLNI